MSNTIKQTRRPKVGTSGCSAFELGQRISFIHGKRRVSGECYDVTPSRKNSMGITVGPMLCVSVWFGANLVNLGVDADWQEARVVQQKQNAPDLARAAQDSIQHDK